ncbi:MAG: M48 family metallopeptidase [Methanobrevibacter sp.]|uniref:M48 family metallopeptidase n=1 Tax=Methanobrevibacter sp. TaxID=66852 RepID=UPI0025CD9E7E|nr:M48 family metallopeptidase [Methanobrevibacter sp.]MBR0271426.1 M48 family metallopeptidase [Methanobrevibacter sp.]
MEIRQMIGILVIIIGIIASLFYIPIIGFIILIAGLLILEENRLSMFLISIGFLITILTWSFIGLIILAVGIVLLVKNIYAPKKITNNVNVSNVPQKVTSKDGRSNVNPFTGKKHYDRVNDDEFLQQSYQQYYSVINQSQIFDETPYGQSMSKVASSLIHAVENHLATIGRSDYTKNYYDWEFHLIGNDSVNAFCMPGGKIVVFSGLATVTDTEDELAFILGHEMAHALLDHSRTKISAQKTKNRLATGARLGSVALSLAGFGTAASATRLATNVADIGSEYFLMKPWGRDQELEADKLGMMIVHWAGYDISGVPSFWEKMSNGKQTDFFSTHPADKKRIKNMKSLLVEIENDKDFSSGPVL